MQWNLIKSWAKNQGYDVFLEKNLQALMKIGMIIIGVK